jgi:hypothetical protein
MEGSFHLKLE